VAGTSIVLKGTEIATTADVNGRFMFTIPELKPGDTLVISFIGFLTAEYQVTKNMKDLRIILQPDRRALEEMIMIVGNVVSRTSCSQKKSLWVRIKNLFN
jgi:hypothetical protein